MMMKKYTWLLPIVPMLLAGYSAAQLERPLLVDAGKPGATIIISGNPERTVRLAAADLQNYLEKISGARLPVATEPEENLPLRIYVGRSDYTDALGLTTDDLEYDAYRIVAGPDYLALLGLDTDFVPPTPWPKDRADRERATREWDEVTGETWLLPVLLGHKEWHEELGVWTYDGQGSFNAVSAWLRQLGVRWYLPGIWGEVVPRRDSIELPQGELCVRPDFAVRQLLLYRRPSHATAEEVLWRMRLGINWGHEKLGLGPRGHGTNRVHGREEVQAAHPEYFALWGKRALKEGAGGDGKPCLSSPGLFEANLRYVRAMLDHYHEPRVSVMPADGYGQLCQCDLCAGKSTPERGYRGRLSDYVWNYVDRVAKEISKTHPGGEISCFAYGTYLFPPLGIEKLSSNIHILFAQWRSMFHDRKLREEMWSLRRDWTGKLADGKRIVLGDYYLHARPNRGWESIPAIFPHLIAEDLREAKDFSVGDYIEIYDLGPRWEGQVLALAANYLNLYVTARLLWDASTDLEALLDEYYRLFFGEAAGEARVLMEYCEANWPYMKNNLETVDRMFELLHEACEAAGEGLARKRLDYLAAYVEPLRELRERMGKTGKPPVERTGVPKAICGLRDPEAATATPKGWSADLWKGQQKYFLKDCASGLDIGDNRTVLISAWSDDSLFFTLRCYDNDMANLNITASENGDEALWFGDCVDIFLETHEHAYYQIAINPAGAMVDADRAEGLDLDWSSGAEVKMTRTDQLWEAQIRIPVQPPPAKDDPLQGVDDITTDGVRGTMPRSSLPWFFNVCRKRVREGEPLQLQAFSPTGQTAFGIREKFAELYVP